LISTATLHEAAGKVGALPAAIKPLSTDMRVCGRAFTVRCPRGDNLALHHALYAATRGDVIVADCGGAEFGYWGELMTVAAQARGLAGLVIFGGVRDSDGIRALRFPVFASAICVRGTSKDPGARDLVGEAILLGDVPVRTGDLVCGDADGVVILPRDQSGDVLTRSRARETLEAAQIQRLRDGETTLEIFRLPELTGSPERGDTSYVTAEASK
jgi:4-hydroxy-4-methyl-2-oxoglutarate aldolase